jgi:TolB protein
MTSTDEQPTSGGEEPWTGADTTGGEPRAAKIVFISDRDGEQRLYWMNPDGSEQAPISAGTGIERDPTWTANGAELLFTRGQDVWRLDLDSGVEVNLTDHPANDALEALSPDDAWFLFTSNRVDQTRDLFVMSAASGGEAIQVADAIEDESLWVSYSPDGGRIVFTTSTFGPDRLVVMNADGTGATDFAGPLGLTELGPPAWSPDGTRIAVSGQTDQPTPVLHVLNPDGTGLTPLTAGYASEPVWSPDGQRIGL